MHVVLSSIAFVVGGIALLSKKGRTLHKRSGLIFFWLMTLSTVLTLCVSMMPYHVSTSMFQISIMTLYFLIGGLRSLSFKNKDHNLKIDKVMAWIVIAISWFIFFYSYALYGGAQPLQTVFGVVATAFGLADLITFHRSPSLKRYWLIFHLSKITAGYTTAVTGFFVAQNVIGGYYNWFTPTVISLIYIFYWMVKLKIIKFRSTKKDFKTFSVSLFSTKNNS